MDVRVCGPNLSSAAQNKGTLHVHEASCKDLNYYGPGRRFGGDRLGTRELLVEHATKTKVSRACYPPEDFGYEPDTHEEGPYISDFWFAPCCAGIPVG